MMLQRAGRADLDPGALCKGLHALPRLDALLAPARGQAQERGQERQRAQPPRARLRLRLGDERQPVEHNIRHLRTAATPLTASCCMACPCKHLQEMSLAAGEGQMSIVKEADHHYAQEVVSVWPLITVEPHTACERAGVLSHVPCPARAGRCLGILGPL